MMMKYKYKWEIEKSGNDQLLVTIADVHIAQAKQQAHLLYALATHHLKMAETQLLSDLALTKMQLVNTKKSVKNHSNLEYLQY